jgi:membrane dipeptidase
MPERAAVVDLVIPFDAICGTTLEGLHAWRDAGVDFVSVHPAGDWTPLAVAVQRVAAVRAGILRDPGLELVETVADVRRAQAAGRLGVGLHLEGSRPFEGDLDLIDAFHALGVRFCHPVFNVQNAFGSGCADPVDGGLTAWGRRATERMIEVGILLDGAHAGRRTSLEMLELAEGPFVFSHVGADAVAPHVRNVTDEQARACAATGGVVGITGNSAYLGGPPTLERLVRHVDHLVELVGPEHVGIGLDHVTDVAALEAHIAGHADEWPGDWSELSFAGPEAIGGLGQELLARGYGERAVRGVLGENVMRVAGEIWG